MESFNIEQGSQLHFFGEKINQGKINYVDIPQSKNILFKESFNGDQCTSSDQNALSETIRLFPYPDDLVLNRTELIILVS